MNGDGAQDAVFNDPAADGPGRANAGRLAILFGPRLAPGPTPEQSPTPTPTSTSDATADPTAVGTGVASPSPTSEGEATATEVSGTPETPPPTATGAVGGGGRVYLPVVWTGTGAVLSDS